MRRVPAAFPRLLVTTLHHPEAEGMTNLLSGAASEAALQFEHGAADFVAHGSVALLVVNHLLLAKKATEESAL